MIWNLIKKNSPNKFQIKVKFHVSSYHECLPETLHENPSLSIHTYTMKKKHNRITFYKVVRKFMNISVRQLNILIILFIISILFSFNKIIL